MFKAKLTIPPIDAALKYARKGWRVIPLHSVNEDGSCTCQNDKCSSPGKHPRIAQWQKTATTNPSTITAWFTQWSSANIGIVGGAESGLAILDVDPRHGGDESMALLEQQFGELPETATVATGGGGLHYYFRYPQEKLGNRTGFRSGLDFKITGGYVVAPPSDHVSGNKYEWLERDFPLAAMPEWLIQVLTERPLPRPVEGASASSRVPSSHGQITKERNNHLFQLGLSLRRSGMEEAEIVTALLSHNELHCEPPLDDVEVQRTAVSAARYETAADSNHHTDMANAAWLVQEFGYNIRFCTDWNKWLVWDGKRFKVDNTYEIDRLAKETARRMRSCAETLTDTRDKERLIMHSLRSEQINRLRAMIELAKSEPGIAVVPDVFDQNPWLFNCDNGTLNLKTGEVKAHDRSDLITKLSPVAFDPEAQCPRWLAFLAKIMDGQEELIAFLQRAAGYTLTASTKEQCLFFLYGTGANGKSSFLNTLATILGDYGGQTPTNTLMAKNNEGIPNDIARLKGLRFVMAAEAELEKALAESLVKQMTGGDRLTGRFLHGEYFEFAAQFKIFLATNHKPVIRGTDDGIWRRIHLIPFDVTIPPEEQDKDLVDKLAQELSGILRWMAEGCLLWQEKRLDAPRQVKAATEEYRSDMDVLAAFLGEGFATGAAYKIKASDLYRLYSDWCSDANEPPMKQNQFGMRLRERNFRPARGRGGERYWQGIGLISQF